MAVHAYVERRIASDLHPQLIAMHKAFQSGWDPPTGIVTKTVYEHVKACPEVYPAEFVGFVGFGCSMHGDYFRGYIDVPGDRRQPGNKKRLAESSRDCLIRQAKYMVGVEFSHCSYEQLEIPDGAWVYCDPPYEGTVGYSVGEFDHAAFWSWACALRSRCTVYVSELKAPTGWECVWSQERSLMGSGRAKRRKVECLFR